MRRALCDTKNCGKLSKDQFALAFHLINQKLIKGIDPPHNLTPEMIPPSDRATLQKVRQLKTLMQLTETNAVSDDKLSLYGIVEKMYLARNRAVYCL